MNKSSLRASRLISAESLFASPIPVRSVSSDEFLPLPQTPRQREFEARIKAAGAQASKRFGMSRRAFFQSAAGMATAFLVMNETYSDTKVACISGAPSEKPEDWFLTNKMKADARANVNAIAGTRPHDVARHFHARLRRLDGRAGA